MATWAGGAGGQSRRAQEGAGGWGQGAGQSPGLSGGSVEQAGWAKAHWAGGDTNRDTDAGGAPEPGAFPCCQDLWMFPNVLLFQPEAARALLEYRIRTLGGALDNARKLGYQVRGTWHPPYRAPAGWCPHIPPRPEPISSGSPLGRAGIPGFFQGLGSTPAPGPSSLAGPSSSPLAALACDRDTAGCSSVRASAQVVRPLLSSVAGEWVGCPWTAQSPGGCSSPAALREPSLPGRAQALVGRSAPRTSTVPRRFTSMELWCWLSSCTITPPR